jgi:Late exocytosis, associated with Golgi transport
VPLPRSERDLSKRVQPLTGGKRILSTLFWPIAVATADYRQIIKANGLDAYFYVRFLRLMVKILLPIWLVSWAVLLPITSVNIDERVTDPAQDQNPDGRGGLTRFTFGNIGPYQQSRLWAHLLCAWFFTREYLSVPKAYRPSDVVISSLDPLEFEAGNGHIRRHSATSFDREGA